MITSQRTVLFLALSVAFSLAVSKTAFGQTLIYAMDADVPAIQIGTDTYSLSLRHVIANGTEQRIVAVTVTPAGGQAQSFVLLDSEAETIAAGITKSLILQADNGRTITQSGQTITMKFETAIMPTQAGGFLMSSNPNGIWSMTYQHAGYPLFTRKYPSASMQQFADYLNLGVAFAKALP